MITQGNQDEEDKIASLSMIGYNKGSKRDLMISLKEIYQSIINESQNNSQKLTPKSSEDEFEFEIESRRIFIEAIKSEVPPKFIYIPTEHTMRWLILRLI